MKRSPTKARKPIINMPAGDHNPWSVFLVLRRLALTSFSAPIAHAGCLRGIALGLSRSGYAGALAARASFTWPSAVALILFTPGISSQGGAHDPLSITVGHRAGMSLRDQHARSANTARQTMTRRCNPCDHSAGSTNTLNSDHLWRSSAKVGSGKFKPVQPLPPA